MVKLGRTLTGNEMAYYISKAIVVSALNIGDAVIKPLIIGTQGVSRPGFPRTTSSIHIEGPYPDLQIAQLLRQGHKDLDRQGCNVRRFAMKKPP